MIILSSFLNSSESHRSQLSVFECFQSSNVYCCGVFEISRNSQALCLEWFFFRNSLISNVFQVFRLKLTGSASLCACSFIFPSSHLTYPISRVWWIEIMTDQHDIRNFSNQSSLNYVCLCLKFSSLYFTHFPHFLLVMSTSKSYYYYSFWPLSTYLYLSYEIY